MTKRAIAALADSLTRLAQYKAPYLAVSVTLQEPWYCGQVIAAHEGKVIAQFGNRLRKTLPELREAMCHYLTFELHISEAKRAWIAAEIIRLKQRSAARPPEPE